MLDPCLKGRCSGHPPWIGGRSELVRIEEDEDTAAQKRPGNPEKAWHTIVFPYVFGPLAARPSRRREICKIPQSWPRTIYYPQRVRIQLRLAENRRLARVLEGDQKQCFFTFDAESHLNRQIVVGLPPEGPY